MRCFSDPGDLLSAIPSTDYCILHTADTVRTLFPRPKLEDGLNEISSVLSPVIADPYALVSLLSVTDMAYSERLLTMGKLTRCRQIVQEFSHHWILASHSRNSIRRN